MGWRSKSSFGKKQRHSRRFLQLEVISKDKLIENEQSGLKIVISSIELSSRCSYRPFKCSNLIPWPNSEGSIFNLKNFQTDEVMSHFQKQPATIII